MELTVQEKIQLALQPLIDRIAILEADSLKFKQEIAQLQTAAQPKAPHKPNVKPGQEASTRPQSGKGSHKALPPTEAGKKKPTGKEQVKEEHEQNKIDDGKHPISTPTATVTGQNPTTHKEPVHQDNKNPKQLKHARPNVALTGGKSKPTDSNNPNAAQQKINQKQKDEKKDTPAVQGESKVISNNNIKKPPPPEKKQIGNINTPKGGATGVKKTQKGVVVDLKKKGPVEVKVEVTKKQEEGQVQQEVKVETKQIIVEEKKQQTIPKEETVNQNHNPNVQESITLAPQTENAVEVPQQVQSESL